VKRARLGVPLAIVVVVATLAFGAMPASASAWGTTPIHTFKYTVKGVTITVPTGCFLTHYINGKGRQVNYANVGTDCAGPGYWWGGFCNYQFIYEFRNLSGFTYGSKYSPVYSSCKYNTYHHFDFSESGLFEVGKACVVFVVGGVRRATQCHNILY